MSVDQATFREAILSPDVARPEGLSDGQGRAAGRRFDVYRNNVAVSLTEALETAFPVVRKLVGEENFKLLAAAFLRQHPPSSPLMMFYGNEMPMFLAAFAPTSKTGYLPDVAHLELALRESYHAADANHVDPRELQEMAPDRLMLSRLHLAPATRLVSSKWPIHTIWRFNMEPGAPKPEMAAEEVLITRPELDPVPHLLPPGGGTFVDFLLQNGTLQDALEAATEATSAFDLSQMLTLLLSTNSLIKIGD